MAKINGIEKLSYIELVKLQQRVEEAIAAKRAADVQATKDQLREMAEKAGFDIESYTASAGQLRAPASPNTATQRTHRRLGRGAVASRTGLLMP